MMIKYSQLMEFRNRSNSKDRNILCTIKLIEVNEQFVLCHLRLAHQFLDIRETKAMHTKAKQQPPSRCKKIRTNRSFLLATCCLWIVSHNRVLKRKRYCLHHHEQKQQMSNVNNFEVRQLPIAASQSQYLGQVIIIILTKGI